MGEGQKNHLGIPMDVQCEFQLKILLYDQLCLRSGVKVRGLLCVVQGRYVDCGVVFVEQPPRQGPWIVVRRGPRSVDCSVVYIPALAADYRMFECRVLDI